MRRSKQRSGKARPLSWYITWAVIDIVIISILLGFILSLPVWQCSNVEVKGNKYLIKDKIIAIAKVPIGENIFMVDPDDIRTRFKDIIQIKEIRIKRKLPATIAIIIKERDPFAIAIIGAAPVLVDDEGFIIAKQNLSSSVYRTEIGKFPVIRGINRKTIENGNRLAEEDRAFMKNTFGLLSKFLDPGVVQIELSDKDNIIVYIEDIIKVKLGDDEKIERKIKVLKVLLEQIKGKWDRVSYIDVRVPDAPAIRFKQ